MPLPTDLTSLAKAISPTAKLIKAYAVAQAAKSVAADKAVADLAAQVAAISRVTVGPGGGGLWPRAQAHFAGDLQAMVDAMPDGHTGWVEPGLYQLTRPLDLTGKNAIRLAGLGGVGFNEGGRFGAVLRATTDGMTLVKDDGAGAYVKHAGPKIEYINFHAAAPNVTLLRARQTNHGLLRECSFQGAFAAGFDLDVPAALYDQGDAAYWDLDHVTFSCLQPDATGLKVGDGYVTMRACNFDMTGLNPYGVKCLRGVVKATQCKWNHAGHHFYTEGAASVLLANDFEIAPWTDTYAVEVARAAADPLPGSGRMNVVAANTFTPHEPPPGRFAKLCKFGPGTGGNVFDAAPTFWNDATSVLDLGVDNTVRIV